MILLSVKPDGSLAGPEDTTPRIAHLEHAMRLWAVADIEYQTLSNPDLTDEDAFSTIQQWFIEKEKSTPFNTIRSLTHLATSIVLQTTRPPQIFWTDRHTWKEMLFKGEKLAFSNIIHCIKQMQSRAISILENDILMETGLYVEHSNIKDDFSNQKVNYSCFSDQRNTCFLDKSLLVQAILKDPHLCSRFFNQQDNHYIWNTGALSAWLEKYAEFSQLLMTIAHILGGSPSRATEICNMHLQNTLTRTNRNLFIMGAYVVLMVIYSKTSGVQTHDKLIPHALDSITGDLLIQDLAICRPFAQMAISALYPNNSSIHHLYHNMIFVGYLTETTTANLTNILSHYTNQYVGFKINTKDWRQIITAFKNKLCTSAMEMYQESEEPKETVSALQFGHRHLTEIKHYGVSFEVLAGLPPEDLLLEFIDCSTDWHITVDTVPGKYNSL